MLCGRRRSASGAGLAPFLSTVEAWTGEAPAAIAVEAAGNSGQRSAAADIRDEVTVSYLSAGRQRILTTGAPPARIVGSSEW